MSKPAYNLSADVIRALAISGVVTIHVVIAVGGRPDFFGGISWWLAIILDSISRVSVPLFIMLSGYFLLNKSESAGDSLKRAWNRITIPLLFWFIADVIWNGSYLSLTDVNLSLMGRLLTVNVFDLYFFIILIGLYCVAPILRNFLQKASYERQRNFMLVTLIGGIVIFLGQYLLYLCTPANALTYWVPYTGLFVAGYVLGNNLTRIKHTKLVASLYLISLSATVGLTYLFNFLNNQGNKLLDSHGCLSFYSASNLSINVVIMSVCAFILLMRMDFSWLHLRIRNLIGSIAGVSLGIYVLHTFFLDILDGRIHFFDHIAPAWLYIIIKWFVIFSLAYITSIILVKIPLVKRVFGETKSNQKRRPS